MADRNLCPNPACAVDATGWTSTPTGYARSTSVDTALPRATGFEDPSATAAGPVDVNTPRCAVTAGQAYVWSISIKALVSTTFDLLINFYNAASGGTNVGSGGTTHFSMTAGQVLRYTIGPVTAPSGAVSGLLKVNDLATGGAELTAVRCAPSSGDAAADSAYYDGSSSGWSWDGTAGSSTATGPAGTTTAAKSFADSATLSESFAFTQTVTGPPPAADRATVTDRFTIQSAGVFADQVSLTDGFLIGSLGFDPDRGRVRITAFTWAPTVTTMRVRWRPLGGQLVEPRGNLIPVVGGVVVRPFDHYEYPPGRVIEYLIEGLTADGTVQQAAVVRRSELAADDVVWLKFIGNPSLNRRLTLTGWSDIETDDNTELFRVQGKSEPVALTDVHSSQVFSIDCAVDTPDQATALRAALAEGQPVYLQVPPRLTCPTVYAVVGKIRQSTPRKRSGRTFFNLPLTEIDPPSPLIAPRGWAYRNSLAAYPTYGDRPSRTYRDVED